MKQTMPRYVPHLALLLCNVLWAMDYPFYHLVMPRYVAPMAMITASLIVTALFAFVPLIWQRAERVDRRDIPKLIVAGLVVGVLRKLFIMYGLSKTSPIDGSIINTVGPLLVLLLSVALGIDRFTRLKVVGLLLGMAGAVAVVMTGTSDVHTHSHLWGNVMILMCAAATACYMVLFKPLVSKYRITTVLQWLYGTATLVILPFGLGEVVHTDFTAITSSGKILFATLFVLVVPTYFPNLMLNFSLRFVKPVVTSIYSYLQPLLAIGVSVAMGLDRLHLDTALFALLIFAGVACVLRSYVVRQPNRAEAPGESIGH